MCTIVINPHHWLWYLSSPPSDSPPIFNPFIILMWSPPSMQHLSSKQQSNEEGTVVGEVDAEVKSPPSISSWGWSRSWGWTVRDGVAGVENTMGSGAVNRRPSRGGQNTTGRYSSFSHANFEFLKCSFNASKPFILFFFPSHHKKKGKKSNNY